MPELTQLDKTFNIIIERMISTGQAPHYTEIATELGVSPPEARKALHEICFKDTYGEKTKAAMNKLLAVCKDEDLRKQAEEIIRQIK